MMIRIMSFSTALATTLCFSGLVFATPTSPTLAPVVPPKAPASTPLRPSPRGLDDAIAALHAYQWNKAIEIYTPLVNASKPLERAQARYGLALALTQLGQEDKALEVLEGTLRDETALGQAIGELRGRLLLQLADKAVSAGSPHAARPYLEQYQRLMDQPDLARYARLTSSDERAQPGLSNTLTVGVMLPQTGDLKDVGLGILKGLQMGLKDFDGRRGTHVNLVVVNTTDATSAETGAKYLLSQHVDVVLGPLLSHTVQAVRDVMRPVAIPVLALTSDRSAVGDGVYALNYLPAEQARAMAQVAISNGTTRFAILAPQTSYGKEAQQAFTEEVNRLGGTVVRQATFNPQDIDVGNSLRTLMKGVKKGDSPDFQALFLPVPGAKMPLLLTQLSYYDIDKPRPDGSKVQLLGTSLWQVPQVTAPAASGMKGSLFATPPRLPDFTTSYQEMFHGTPHPLSVLGYDSARILSDIASEKQRTNETVEHLFLRPEGFYGTGGFFRFTSSGVTQRGLSIVKVTDQFEVIQEGLKMAPLTRTDN